jgi:hypothetical protein
MSRPFVRLSTWLVLPALLALSACKKEPGIGGKSEIRGYVMRQDINNNNGLPIGDPYAYPEARVYIRYGDHDFHDDDVRTGPDGLYVFSWLREGTYTVFTYSECDNANCIEAVQQTVSADGKDEVVNVPTMISENW